MPHRRPKDYPGAWWHLTNRGIAKRTAFENRQDVEVFLECLAKAVTDGHIAKYAPRVISPTVVGVWFKSPPIGPSTRGA